MASCLILSLCGLTLIAGEQPQFQLPRSTAPATATPPAPIQFQSKRSQIVMQPVLRVPQIELDAQMQGQSDAPEPSRRLTPTPPTERITKVPQQSGFEFSSLPAETAPAAPERIRTSGPSAGAQTVNKSPISVPALQSSTAHKPAIERRAPRSTTVSSLPAKPKMNRSIQVVSFVTEETKTIPATQTRRAVQGSHPVQQNVAPPKPRRINQTYRFTAPAVEFSPAPPKTKSTGSYSKPPITRRIERQPVLVRQRVLPQQKSRVCPACGQIHRESYLHR